MKKLQTIKSLSLFSAIGIGGLHVINQVIDHKIPDRQPRRTGQLSSFTWKYGNVYYQKAGKGSPVLLIHDTESFLCSDEWQTLIPLISRDYTVYSIDLLGCGLSEKPAITYTNYVYALLIQDFIREVIKEPVMIIGSGFSSSFIPTANLLCPDLIRRIVMINPSSLNSLSRSLTKTSEGVKTIFSLPVIGRTLFQIYCNRKNIEYRLVEKYFGNPFKLRQKNVLCAYTNAHQDNSRSRYFLGSLLGRYMHFDIRRALKLTKTPICIIYQDNLTKSQKIAKEYRQYHQNTIIYPIHSGFLPQLEVPEETYRLIIDADHLH